MRNFVKRARVLLLILLLCLSCGLPALAAEQAAAIKLNKAEGAVAVSNPAGRAVTVKEKMGLYSGYRVSTQAKSYAWILLDESKLGKLDAVSAAEMRKSGKLLEVLVSSGNLFFNVSKPLGGDESLNIRTSTTVMGIRGTCGWVEVADQYTTRLNLLEGQVECTVTDPVSGQSKTVLVKAGEKMTFVVREQGNDRCDIIREELTEEDVPGMALTELAGDPALCDSIARVAGLDLTAITQEQAEARLKADQAALAEQLKTIGTTKNKTSRSALWEVRVSSAGNDNDPGGDNNNDNNNTNNGYTIVGGLAGFEPNGP